MVWAEAGPVAKPAAKAPVIARVAIRAVLEVDFIVSLRLDTVIFVIEPSGRCLTTISKVDTVLSKNNTARQWAKCGKIGAFGASHRRTRRKTPGAMLRASGVRSDRTR